MYYVKDSHAGIISDEMFDCVQQEFAKRNELRGAGTSGKGEYSGKYVFSGMIICGNCGETYRRHQQYIKNKKYYIWVCKRHENMGKAYCDAKPIKEENIKTAFIRAVNNLIIDKESIFEKSKNVIVSNVNDSSGERIAQIDAKIANNQNAIMNKLTKKQNGVIFKEEYDKAAKKLMDEIDSMNLERIELLDEKGRTQLATYRKDEICKLIDTGELLKEFDETIFKSLIKDIKAVGYKEIEINFECGITIREGYIG